METALSRKLTTSVLTLDLKGAFDGILPGRLVRRFREQGWPENNVLWVTSFVTNRVVRIRLNGLVSPKTKVHCGLPQGSPVSPILFMLYLSPLFLLGSAKNKFGYADDVALLRTSSTLQENAALLSRDLQEAIDWGQEEGITFDSGKYELLHFTRRRADQDSRLTPRVRAGPLTIAENTSHP